jgi:hypothetical protein
VDASTAQEVAALWEAAMRRGDWEAAWRQTDRIELPRRGHQRLPGFVREPWHLRWDGTPFDGRRVLVRCEHGLGDTLLFIRYLPLLVRAAREAHLLVQPHLLALLGGAPGLGEVRDGWTDAPPPAHDVEVEVMELPYAFRSTTATVPPPYPYLAGQAAGGFDLGTPGDDRLRVGLVWSCSDWGHTRSIDFPLLEPLLASPHALFFSLQQGPDAVEPGIERAGMVALSPRTSTIEAAAAAMLQLDLVITVDAMTAHLAGTLGRATWLLLKHHADWRWMDGRTDSPWYPGMRLFRQPGPGDWAGVVEAVRQALADCR